MKTSEYKYISSYIHILQKSLANIKSPIDRFLGSNNLANKASTENTD
jgi:hypothetical protein